MRRHAITVFCALASLTVLAAPPAKPSVLVVTLDTTRADRLGCYGSAAGLTPSLDAFAAHATLFEHAEAAIPQTVPSHLTLFSGWNPNRHGVRKNLEVRVPASVPLLAEEFKSAGYSTGAFVSAMVLLGRYGMGRGFDTYEDSFFDRRRTDAVERKSGDTLKLALPWVRARKGPWFCWIHLYDPHIPYAPPEPYATKYKARPYDGEVASMDAALGEFLDALEASGALADAVVLICGDHGESLGEHGELTHSLFLYEATTRVPLLVRLPGQTEARRLAQDVGLVDLAPTLRELAGLPAEPADGVSLAPLLQGRPWARGPVYLESLEALYSFGWAPLYGSVEGRSKYILAPRPELYRLDADPGERDNRAGREAAEAKRRREWVQGEIAKAATAAQGEKIALDPEELKSLQSLGYIAGSMGKSARAYRDPKDMAPMLKDCTLAEQLFLEGRRDEAVTKLERVLPKDPGNPLFNYYLGACYEEKNPAKAERFYKKAISVRPGFPQPYSRLVLMWINGDRAREAWQLGALGVKEVDDFNGELHALTGYAALKSGRPAAEVLAFLEAAKERGPELPMALKARAVLALQAGDKEAAVGYLQRMAQEAEPGYITQLAGDPRFEPLREDSRFWTLILGARKALSGR